MAKKQKSNDDTASATAKNASVEASTDSAEAPDTCQFVDVTFSTPEIEDAIRKGAEMFIQDGVPKKDAMRIARNVFADIHVIQGLTLKYPYFAEVLDLLEATEGMPLLDQTHRLRVQTTEVSSHTIATIHDLVFRMYLVGFFHGHLMARLNDDIDATFDIDFVKQSKEKSEYILNSISRAYGVLLPDAVETGESSVTIETVAPLQIKKNPPKYKNSSLFEF